MRLFDSRIEIPVGGYPLHLTITSPRKPSAFERIIVFIVDRYNKTGIAESSVKEIFDSVFGLTDVDVFLDQALDELSSASVGVIQLNDYSVPARDIPIGSISLTEDGKQLIKTGQLPGARKEIKRFLYYDFINKKVSAQETRSKRQASFPAISFESFTNNTMMIPRNDFMEYLQNTMHKDVNILDMTCNEIQKMYKTVFINIEINNNEITLKCKEYPETEAYLRSIPVEMLQNLFFTQHFDVPMLSDNVYIFDPDKFQSIQSPHDFTDSLPSSLDCLVYTHNDVRKKIGTIINLVCYEGAEETVIFERETREALIAINYELPWEPNGFSDLNTIWEVSRFQFQYNGNFVTLPLGVKYEFPIEIKQAITQKAFSLMCDSNDNAKYSFLLFMFSRNKTQREHICKMLRQEENLNSVLHDVASFFANIKRECDMESLVKEVFPLETINSLREMDVLLNVLEDFSFSTTFQETVRKGIARKVEEMHVDSLDEWDKQTTILQECDKSCSDAHLNKIVELAPKTSLNDLLVFAKKSEKILSGRKLSPKFPALLEQMLASVTNKKKKTLDDFVAFVDEVSDSNDELRKALYCTVDQFVLIPESPDERINFAQKALLHGIPPPNNLFADDTAEYIIIMDFQGKPDLFNFLNKIKMLRPLLNLNAQRVAISQILGISSLSDYTSLSSDSNINEIEKLCKEWLENWSVTGDFFEVQDNYCKNIISVIRKILMDVQEYKKRVNVKKYYVFDTSALIHKPDILFCGNRNSVFVIPKMVLQELDGMKKDNTLQSDEKKNLRTVIRNISKIEHQVEDSSIDLLPEDYRNNSSHDDAILSVALKIASNDEEVIIVSDDINFSNKAIGEKIPVFSAKKTITQLKKPQRKE